MNEGTLTICFPTLQFGLVRNAARDTGVEFNGIPDVPLFDQNTRVVDAFGETEFVDACLQTTLQEIFDLEGEHVIQLHARLVQDTDTDKTANEGIAFE